MTAEECRTMQTRIVKTDVSQVQALWEIAAQLAELNEKQSAKKILDNLSLGI